MTVEAKNSTENQLTATADPGQSALDALKSTKQHMQNAAIRAYSDQKKPSDQTEMITELLPMVPKIVNRVMSYLKPPLTFEDLVSAGTIGLVKAARDFDPSRQAEFKTYAYIRIKGAIIDELRSWSFMPVNKAKQLQSATQLSREITEQTGIAPTDEELAEKLEITVEKLHETMQSARARHFLSIDGASDEKPALSNLLPETKTCAPGEQLERTELIENLSKAIGQLQEKQRQIILLYYQQHLTMKQIARVLKVTESRVSQMHASAIFNLSIKLRQFKDGK